MKIIADANKVRVEDWHILSGEYNNRTVEVQLSKDLLDCEGCIVTFELSNDTRIEFPVKNGQIEVVCFIEPQQITVGVYTYDTDESSNLIKRYSPEPCKTWIKQGSFGGVNEPLLSPGRYSELLKEIDNMPQSDFDQNDPTQKDYIKNRPFYKEEVEVDYLTLPYVETDSGAVAIGNKIGLEVGKDYTVDIYNNSGNVESVTMQGVDTTEAFGFSAVILGDGETVPFIAVDGAMLDDEGNLYQADNALYTFSEDYSKIVIHGISSFVCIFHTLSADYLPEINGNKIRDNSISQEKLSSGSVGTNEIIDGSVTTSKIADLAISTKQIADKSVTSKKIDDNAITETKLNDWAVTSNKIADNSVSTSKLQNLSVTNDKLADDISRFKLNKSKVINTCVVAESETIGVFSGTNINIFSKEGQRVVIYGTIVSSDTESTEQTLNLQGRFGSSLSTIASITADFSSSKLWNLWCVVEKYNENAYKVEMLLSTADGERLSSFQSCTFSSSFSRVSLLFSDSTTHQMAYGTNLKLCAY